MRITLVVLAAPILALCRAQDIAVQLRPFPGGYAKSRAVAIAEAPDAAMWFLFQSDIMRHDGERLTSVPLAGDEDSTIGLNRSLSFSRRAAFVSGADGVWTAPLDGGPAVRVRGSERLNPTRAIADDEGNLWIVSATNELHWLGEGSRIEALRGGPFLQVRDIFTVGHRVWAWTDRGLLRLHGKAGEAAGDLVVALPDIRVATERDGSILAITARGLHRVDAAGDVTDLLLTDRLDTAAEVAVADGLIWVRTTTELLSIRGDEIRCVRLHTDSGSLPPPDTSSIATDGQGILWIGGQTTVYRAQVLAAIDNRVMAELAANEQVNAIVEHDSTIWLGTDHGRLLRQGQDGWVPLATPWPLATLQRQRQTGSILALTSAPTGHMVVGTRERGVWAYRGDWVCLDDTVTDVRALITDGAGTLWIAANQSIHRADLTAAVPRITEFQVLSTPARPTAFAMDARGSVWLAAFRGGLLRKEAGATAFESQAADWCEHNVLHLATDLTGQHLWVATSAGLWHMNTTTGVRTLVRSSSRGATIRMVAGLPDGSVWFTQSNSLAHYDPTTGKWTELPPGCSSHPGGISHRACFVRKDGETWLGARAGYSRLLPDAHHHLAWPVRLAGTSVVVDGVALLGGGPSRNRWEVHSPCVSVAIRPTLIDRNFDTSLGRELILRNALGVEFRSTNGQFTELTPDVYEVTVSAQQPTGHHTTFSLGHLHVLHPPLHWPWLLAAAALLGGSMAWWAGARRGKPTPPRRLVIAEIPDFDGQSRDELQAAAWLAVVSGEITHLQVRARHTSVWLRNNQTNRGHCLASFGTACDAAAHRLSDCIEHGLVVGDGVRFANDRDIKDLVVRATTMEGAEFGILMHGVPTVDAATVAAIQLSTEPLFTALRKNRWIDSLERNFASKTAMLEVEAHDLRSPLAVLRITACELVEKVANQECPHLRSAAHTMHSAVESVLKAFEHMVAQFQANTQVTLAQARPATIAMKVVQALTPVANAKEIGIETSVEGDDVTAMLDETWFYRVIENVVGNAIKYSPRGGSVRVSTFCNGSEVVLRVEDTGPGFSALEREAAFLPGMTGRAKPTAGESQSGMGLWIARQALQAMGGRIWIESRGDRGGSVLLALPRTPAN